MDKNPSLPTWCLCTLMWAIDKLYESPKHKGWKLGFQEIKPGIIKHKTLIYRLDNR